MHEDLTAGMLRFRKGNFEVQRQWHPVVGRAVQQRLKFIFLIIRFNKAHRYKTSNYSVGNVLMTDGLLTLHSYIFVKSIVLYNSKVLFFFYVTGED